MLLMGKSTISMAIFNSYCCLPEGISYMTINQDGFQATLELQAWLHPL